MIDGAARAPHRPPLRRVPRPPARRRRPRRSGSAASASGSLASAATSQQVSSTKLPAARGSIVDRKGNPLAVSEPAADVSATPYLVKDPIKAAEKLAPVLGQTPEALVQKLARKDTGFVYLARDIPADQATKVQKLKLTGIALDPRPPALLPARVPRRPAARLGRHRRQRPVGARVRAQQDPDRHRRRAAARQGRARAVDQRPRHEAGEVRRAPRVDDRRRDPGRGRARPDPGRQDLPAEGRDGDRHGPARQRGPRDGQLAADRRQRPGRRARLRRPEPRRRLDLRAGLDVQGGHGRGRARGERRQARQRVHPPAADPGRRPHDRRVAPARRPRRSAPPRSSPSRATSARSRSA